jgi:uncharacterized protein
VIRTLGALAGAGVAAGAAGLGYASLVERRRFTLRWETVPALPPAPGVRGVGGRGAGGGVQGVGDAGGGIRILHVSDLHYVPGQERKLEFVRSLAGVSPDLVVSTGDFLGHRDAVEPVLDALRDLAAGRLAVAVLGSNDVYGPVVKNPARYLRGPSDIHEGARLDTGKLVAGLEESGWRVLHNERATVGPADVVGLGDPHVGWDEPGRVPWDDDPGGARLRLGVVHAPYLRALRTFAGRGIDLAFAGHTHGGQLRIPGYGALVTNCDLPRAQARGLSQVEGMWLHVSGGLGESMFAPVRFACPPEASVVDVVPAPA